jgi:hypothetical protein
MNTGPCPKGGVERIVMKGEALLCPQWRDLCRLIVKVSLGKAWSEKINKKENRKKRACTRLNVSVSAY